MTLKNLIKIAASLIFLLLIYLTYSYFKSNEPIEIPIIEPEIAATRVKPVDAGGIILPHSDSIIYENMSKGGKPKKIDILPEPEQALAIMGQKNNDNGLENSIDSMLASLSQPAEKATETYEDDQDIQSIFDDIPNNDQEAGKPQDFESDVNDDANAKSLNVMKVTANSNKRIGDVKNHAGPQKESYKIQLGSMKSLSLAITEGERIKRKHSKIIGNSVITHKKVQQDKSKFFYVILAGDYPTISKAKAACKKLSARQQSCMIYKP